MVRSSDSTFTKRVHLVVLSAALAFACAVLGAAFTTESAYAAETTNTATLSVTGTNDQTDARTILAMVNKVRAMDKNPNNANESKTPVADLTWDYELEKAAIQRAAELSVYWNHTRPNGADFSTAIPSSLGYRWEGENIHVSSTTATAADANDGWTKSPGHYANMINGNFTCMAAASFKIDGCTYWVELFGSPNKGVTPTNAVNGTCTYTVEAIPSLLDLSLSGGLSANTAKGSSAQYRVINTNKGVKEVSPTAIFDTTINATSFNWSSSNVNAASVDTSGKATVKGAGAVTITAKNKTLDSIVLTSVVTLKAPSSSSSPTSTTYKEGWVKSGSRWWYRYTDGSYAKGLTPISGVNYYFDNSGWMKTGWQSIGGSWYYFAGSGAMKTGWAKVSGKWYYMAADGKMQTGRQTIDKKLYFLDKNGAMRTGWVKDGSDWYYCNSSGAATTGWQKIKGTWYYMNSNGTMRTGWLTEGGTTYYLAGSGAMTKGWKQIESSWYYFSGSGVMKTGWQKVSGKWYLLDSDGKMLTGWQEVGGKSYYMNGSGVMQANKWIGNYYVQGDGVMATNKWIGNYHVNADGLWDQTRKAGSVVASSAIPGTVYWTPSGAKYHATSNCATLKNSTTIKSGSVSQAGSRSACKVCIH